MQDYYMADNLKQFCIDAFRSVGLPKIDAEVTADSLIEADLEEAGTHGISRLPIYIQNLKNGRINNKPHITVKRKGTALIVDGDNGLGQVVANRAVDEAIKEAKQSGIVGAFVSNSNHFGAAAYFCKKASQHNMAMIATTNSPSAIAPWGGKQAYFGTNPIAFGFPTEKDGPVIIDMSSSVVARGNIILAEKEGKEIPSSWALDEHGNKTTNPSKALNGSMLPLGGPKGYALAMAVEILSGILTSSAFGPHVNNIYSQNNEQANVGHSFILMNISNIMENEMYFSRIHQLINEIKESERKEGVSEILYPGERRYRAFIRNKHNGIPLSPRIKDELFKLSKEQGITFPHPLSV